MTKYQTLVDIIEAGLDARVTVKSVLVGAGALTIGAIVLKLILQKRKKDG